MTRYILSRLVESAIVLLVMSFIIYCLIGLMPGDPIDAMVTSNPGFTAQDVERLRALYGLDQPITTRYWNWLMAALQFDFGYSRIFQKPALEVLMPAVWHTTKLVGLVFTCVTIIALTLGVLAALNKGKTIDTIINVVAFAGISVPTFWLALLMIIVFAVWLGVLPASGMYTIGGGGGFADQMRYFILPVATLTLAQTGSFVRYTRASMVETLRLDFIRTARAKGASEGRVVFRHALRNAMIPVVTVMALSFGGLLSGALIVETMFAHRGMGKLIYDSVMGNDFNLALMGLLFATLVTLMANLLADLAYAWLDPRISLK